MSAGYGSIKRCSDVASGAIVHEAAAKREWSLATLDVTNSQNGMAYANVMSWILESNGGQEPAT